MDQRAIRAGVGSSIVALLVGATLGTYGGWAPVFDLASTSLGSWLVAIVLGTVLAYIYGYWFNAFLPGTTVTRGIIFGVLAWILMLILGGVSGFFKEATYPNPAGPTIFLTLLLHVVWGSILGILYETR
ncbi:MAG: hypothetical protein A2172_03030 [Candidatus Woykebacteria bacterium RBG_13_40_15]|uniref:Major facilitator superfamily (MFS) profile domain-containing protein n=1 Tax=Candidatus Woykebacteria bacterium RBG_13_40_15 TaxID=1802593 RepID=A0A1G1W5E1_9BACT|nr:MAG: hypothetical protein A2172_03030 [Candidatus Woykebacteria bacterium RBG_13_40_15]